MSLPSGILELDGAVNAAATVRARPVWPARAGIRALFGV